MKNRQRIFSAILASTGMSIFGAGLGWGQTYTPGYYPAPPVPQYVAPAPVTYTAQQLDQLVGPVALYPDPLLDEVLAGATYSQDIAAAQQWLQYFPNPSEQDIDQQPWDPSVKALVHYPSVLSMMASQPDWTAALGAAFANQPQDVMDAVQRMRQQAVAAQTLVSTPQQQVVNDNGVIEVLPAAPNVIYVPEYDPAVVYVAHPGWNQPWIRFGPACAVGVWLDLGWDWHHRRFNQGIHWGGDWRHPRWDRGHEWHHNPGRPIVPPRYFPGRPHGVEPRHDSDWERNRGWDQGRRPGPAFDERMRSGEAHGREGAPGGPRPGERPVTGIPEHHEASGRGNAGQGNRGREHGQQPGPRAVAPPHGAEAPRQPVAPHVEAPRAPEAPHGPVAPHVEAPRAPEHPAPAARQRVVPPPRNIAERPVQGIPRQAPGGGGRGGGGGGRGGEAHGGGNAAPSPVFHSEGGAGVQSQRGHSSMRH